MLQRYKFRGKSQRFSFVSSVTVMTMVSLYFRNAKAAFQNFEKAFLKFEAPFRFMFSARYKWRLLAEFPDGADLGDFPDAWKRRLLLFLFFEIKTYADTKNREALQHASRLLFLCYWFRQTNCRVTRRVFAAMLPAKNVSRHQAFPARRR